MNLSHNVNFILATCGHEKIVYLLLFILLYFHLNFLL